MLNQATVKELLHYDPITGIFTWKERSNDRFATKHHAKTWNKKFPGKRAGGVHTGKLGYQWREISIFNKSYKEHRLAWLYMKGVLPDVPLDHKNRNALDNNWLNIRKSSHRNNSRNKSMSRTNKSGVTGVHWHKKQKVWQANVIYNGKRVFLGSFKDINDAEIAVRNFKEQNGYDPSHGILPTPYFKPEQKTV